MRAAAPARPAVRTLTESGGGGDQITVQFSTMDPGSESLFHSGDGNDSVVFLGTNFEDDVEIDLGDGDDDILVQDGDFDGEIFGTGGDGDDEADLAGDNSFDLGEPRRVQEFEDFD